MITKASLSVTTQRADGCTFGRAGGSSSCRGRRHAVAVLRAWLRRRCVLVWCRDGLLPPRIETGSAIVTNSDAFGCPHGHPERRPTPLHSLSAVRAVIQADASNRDGDPAAPPPSVPASAPCVH